MCHCRSIVAAGFVHCVHNYVNASLMRVSQCRSIVANTHTHTEKKTAKLHAMDEKRQTITKEKTRTKHVDMKWTDKTNIYISVVFFFICISTVYSKFTVFCARHDCIRNTHKNQKCVTSYYVVYVYCACYVSNIFKWKERHRKKKHNKIIIINNKH